MSYNVKDKIKTHESPGLCFKLFILSRKRQTKLKLVLTQKFFVQVYTHFGPAVKKVKTERVDQIDTQFFALVGVREFKRSPLTAFKNILIYTQGISK